MTQIIRSIPAYSAEDNVTGCCPVFHPEHYDNKLFDLSDLHFIQASTKSLMYVPTNMDKVFTKTQADIEASGQGIHDRYLILSQDVSPFKCNHYFMTQGPVKDYPNIEIKGNYLAKVYEGDFKDMGKWVKDFSKVLKEHGNPKSSIYTFYTTCPNCAKVYGHNYVVLFGEQVNA